MVDGHDVDALCRAFYEATTVRDKPTCLLAKTFKGRGVPGIEDADDWHGRALGSAKSDSILATIKGHIAHSGPHGLRPALPADTLSEVPFGGIQMSDPPAYKLGEKVFVVCLVLLILPCTIWSNCTSYYHVMLALDFFKQTDSCLGSGRNRDI